MSSTLQVQNVWIQSSVGHIVSSLANVVFSDWLLELQSKIQKSKPYPSTNDTIFFPRLTTTGLFANHCGVMLIIHLHTRHRFEAHEGGISLTRQDLRLNSSYVERSARDVQGLTWRTKPSKIPCVNNKKKNTTPSTSISHEHHPLFMFLVLIYPSLQFFLVRERYSYSLVSTCLIE